MNIKRYLKLTLALLVTVVLLLLLLVKVGKGPSLENGKRQAESSARVMINGDLLYHDIVYWSAKQDDGSYDFRNNYRYVKDWIQQADLAIADYEGTITPERELAGYPLFNTPIEVADAIKDTGYDVMAIANNHILDMNLPGVYSTKKAFEDRGMYVIGAYTEPTRAKENILVKEVNGIKIALLNYSYGYNGMEQNLSQEDYEKHMSDLDENRIKEEIEYAEKVADITLVMPHMGVEYQLSPTPEQKALYHRMIEWGADLVIGGHPHVVEPTEVVEKDGEKKFIIYSMGNFISNQRIETLDNKWTERGCLVDLTIKKDNTHTYLAQAKVHPTWVNRVPNGKSGHGFGLFDYSTYVLEDWIEGGKYYGKLDSQTQNRVNKAYEETKKLLNLHF